MALTPNRKMRKTDVPLHLIVLRPGNTRQGQRRPGRRVTAWEQASAGRAPRFPLCPEMCYNLRAVERTELPEQKDTAGTGSGGPEPQVAPEPASSYCPRCAQPLQARSCKLACPVCGYYMSCSDFY